MKKCGKHDCIFGYFAFILKNGNKLLFIFQYLQLSAELLELNFNNFGEKNLSFCFDNN